MCGRTMADIDGNGGNLTGLDPAIDEVYDFDWEEGSDEVLRDSATTA